MDYESSNDYSTETSEVNLLNENEELEAFESDNVHPRFYKIFTDYKFQTRLGEEIREKFQDDSHKTQAQMQNNFF